MNAQPIPNPRRNTITLLLLASVLVGFVLVSPLANGYYFGSSDQFEQVPMIRRVLDPAHLQSDWFMSVTSGFNHRTFYSHTMAELTKLAGMELAFLLVYLGTLLAFGITAWLAAVRAWRAPQVGLIAVLILLYSRLGSLGGSFLMNTMLIPSLIAFALGLLGACLLWYERYAGGIMLIALAGLIQSLVGVEVGLLAAAALFLTLSAERRTRFLRWMPLLLGICAIITVSGLYVTGNGSQPVDKTEVIRVLAYIRAPHHYVPFAWPSRVWIDFAMFIVLFLTAALSVPRVPFFDWLALGVLVCCLVGALALVVHPLAQLVALQPYRMTVLLQWIGPLYLARYLWELPRARGWSGLYAGIIFLAGIVLAQHFTLTFPRWLAGAVLVYELADRLVVRYAVHQRHWRWLSVLAPSVLGYITIRETLAAIGKLPPQYAANFWVIGFSLLVCLPLLLSVSSVPRRLLVASGGGVLLAALAVTIWYAVWVGTKLPPSLQTYTTYVRPHLMYYPWIELDNLQLWVRDHTPRDAVFLVPPDMASFRLKAERAIVVDWKADPIKDEALLMWRDRLYDLAGGRFDADDPYGYNAYNQLMSGFNSLGGVDLVRLAYKYGASYIVVKQKIDLPVVYKGKEYLVYQLLPQAP